MNNWTATFIKSLNGFTGDARLYKLNPPMQIREYNSKTKEGVMIPGPVLKWRG